MNLSHFYDFGLPTKHVFNFLGYLPFRADSSKVSSNNKIPQKHIHICQAFDWTKSMEFGPKQTKIEQRNWPA